MAPILTSEDVRRIAAECTFVDERGAVGIRLEPAAAIIRQYGEPFRAPWRQRRPRSAKPPPLLRALSGQWCFGVFLNLTFATRNPLNRLLGKTCQKS